MSTEFHFEIEGLNANSQVHSYPLYLMSFNSNAKNPLIEDEESPDVENILSEGIENLDNNLANALLDESKLNSKKKKLTQEILETIPKENTEQYPILIQKNDEIFLYGYHGNSKWGITHLKELSGKFNKNEFGLVCNTPCQSSKTINSKIYDTIAAKNAHQWFWLETERSIGEKIEKLNYVESFNINSKKQCGIVTLNDNDELRNLPSDLANILRECGVVYKTFGSKKRTELRWLLGKIAVGLILGFGLLILHLTGVALSFYPLLAVGIFSSLVAVALGWPTYKKAWADLKKGKLGMAALFSVSTLTAIGSSLVSVFIPGVPMLFDTALLIWAFKYVGAFIERKVKANTTAGLSLRDRIPKKVQRFRNNQWEETNIRELQKGDIIRLYKGNVVPVDGIYISNTAKNISTQHINGQSHTTFVRDMALLAGMQLPETTDSIKMEVQFTEAESYLAKEEEYLHEIDKNIDKNQKKKDNRTPIEKMADTIQQYFVPGLIIMSAIVGVIGATFFPPTLAAQAVLLLLVSACPCVFSLIIPLLIKIGMRKAANAGARFKNPKCFENATQIDTVAFDLNETLTCGIKSVNHCHIDATVTDKDEFLSVCYALEKTTQAEKAAKRTKHAMAKALTQGIKKIFKPKVFPNLESIILHRNGREARIDNNDYIIGDLTLMKNKLITIPSDVIKKAQAHNDGKCGKHNKIVYVTKNGKFAGYFVLRDALRPESFHVVQKLQKLGKTVYVYTGSSEDEALPFTRELGIPDENVLCRLSASGKAERVVALQKDKHRVAMVGDGSNDRDALRAADLGIGIQSSNNPFSNSVQEAADVWIDKQSLYPVLTTFAVAKQTMRNIKLNLGIALSYNAFMFIATLTLLAGFSFVLNPFVGALAMAVESTVILGLVLLSKRQKVSQPPMAETRPSQNNTVNLIRHDNKNWDKRLSNAPSPAEMRNNKLAQSPVLPDNNYMPYNPNLTPGYQTY